MQREAVPITLSDGTVVYDYVRHHAQTLHDQVQEYFTPDICAILAEEDITVFDVGANIGLFSREVLKRARSLRTLYAFEPILPTYRLLERNVKGDADAKIQLQCRGLGEAQGRATFNYLPDTAAMSTMYALGSAEDKQSAMAMIRLQKQNPKSGKMPAFFNRLPDWLCRQLVDLFYYRQRKTSRQIMCEMTTVSDVISKNGINRIDLLKIDVEKAELGLLMGISTSDWQRIRTVVVEVHDIDDRVFKIETLLKENGFGRIYTDRPSEMAPFFNLFAFRTRGKVSA